MKERILVLDDDERWLRVIAAILSSEYELFLTASNQEAVDAVKKTHFVLVVLDWKLQNGTTALEVLEQMRQSVPDLRAIILTALDKSDHAVASLQAGALDYITKGPRRSANGNLSQKLFAAINKHKKGNDLIKVFLSYARSDRIKVARLRSKLMARGFLPWFDLDDNEAGRWEPQIKKALRDADYFLVCLTPDYINKSGFNKKELKWALEKQDELAHDEAYIIPARLRECELPEQLAPFQRVDLFREGGFIKLVKMLLAKKNRKK